MAIEYVYALHDFEPQNDDEIAFVAGERIEVLEKDDAYGDGWWTGRNLAGHTGIFPKDYTMPGPLIPDLRTPTGNTNFHGQAGTTNNQAAGYSTSSFHSAGYGSTLHPLTEEPESDTAQGAPMPNGSKSHGGGQVMAATMTDIQQAIDQFGANRSHSAMTDDNRSMSFASTRDDRTSIDDRSLRAYDDRSIRDSMYDEADITPGGTNRMTMNEDWHRDARRRLFEKVDQMDMARRLEEESDDAYDRHHHRPPVEAEFSDESEDEDGHHHHHHHSRDPQHHKLHHDDSIPSTLPSTFAPDASTTSLPRDDAGGDADVSNVSTAGVKRLTESPAKADSPTLAIHSEAEVETRREATPTPAPAPVTGSQDKRAITPVPEPKPAPVPVMDNTPPTKKASETSEKTPSQYLPNLAPTSPFSPLVNSPPLTATATNTIYPISSSSHPVEPAKSTPPKSTPPLSATPSYVSFLPSPTAATFSSAQNGTTHAPPSTSTNAPATVSTSAPTISPAPRTSSPAPKAIQSERISQEHGSTTAPSSAAEHSFVSTTPGTAASIISTAPSASLVPPPGAASQTSPKLKKPPPSEWSVDQVVEWLKSKGFDDGVCSKFIEHEITGDVLLEFDVNMLKEIDIVAFGKRMKIANAINELRRPPSFESSDAASLKPQSISQFSMGGAPSQMSSAPQSSTAQQFGASTSMPNIVPSHYQSLSQSTQGYNASISSGGLSAMNSPNIFGMLQSQQAQPYPNGNFSPNPYVTVTGDTAGPTASTSYDQQRIPNAGHVHARVDSDPGVNAVGEAARIAMSMSGMTLSDKAATVGHGASKGKGRPSSLALSPSDTALAQRGVVPVSEEEDDRTAMSDSDIRKRKKEILSIDSAASRDPPDTPNSRSDTPSRASGRPRSSLDTKPSDRLSFFSAISRNRKPAPRYSSDQSAELGPTRPPRVGKAKEEREKEKREKEERERVKRESKERERAHEREMEHPAGPAGVLRKRTLSGDPRSNMLSSTNESPISPKTPSGAITLKPGEPVLPQLNSILGEADHSGFMLKKGERYSTWKSRFFFLKGPHLYYLRSKQETRMKGYINIRGYKIIADEATHPGRYGFRIIHDTQKPHFFSSEDQATVRDWMKALMKATIDRDFARPVVSSCNIPTIPLTVAQAMNPAPRPPSPKAIAAAQKARQADNSGLSSRDAKVLMGIAEGSAVLGAVPGPSAPQRPSREMRRPSIVNKSEGTKAGGSNSNAALIQWINSQLPDQTPLATDLSSSLSSGLILFRLAESIKYGRDYASARLRSPSPDDPIVPDHLFDNQEERIDGLMKLFDFLVDNDVKLSGISLADVRDARPDKIIALVRSMKQWYDRRETIAKNVGAGGPASMITWIQG